MTMKLKYRLLMADENGGDAGTSAPAAATDDSAGGDDSAVNWEEFADDSSTEGEFDISGQDTSSGQETQGQVQKPAGQVATETPTPPVAQTPPAKADASASETPPQAAATAPAGQTTEAQATETFDWSKWEQDSIAALTNEYQLSEEETSQMLTEPELVLPKLAASVHARVVKNILAHLPTVLPGLINQVTQGAQQESSLREQFFSVNDDLNNPQYETAIAQAGKLYRQLNPTADAATATIHVGNMVRNALGLPPKTQTPPPGGNEQPAASTVRQPFTPATGGSGGGKVVSDNNPFAAFADELDALDSV